MGTVEPSDPPAWEDPAYQVFLDSLDYLSSADIGRVKEAYVFSARAHANQKRMSGEPYITHPLAVAGAVAEWRMDGEAVAAALLHDVLEDTATSKRDLADRFGREVAELVDGLSKLDRMEFATYQEAQAENFRKMLMAMARDLRVVLIKLADRQHNLQTMAGMRPDKCRRIAIETLDIYAPIALRLGLSKLCRELQDMSFQLIHPYRAAVLSKALQAARGNRRELLLWIQDAIAGKLAEAGLHADVFGREKSLFSIYRKMREKCVSFSEVLDLYGFRVVVDSVPHCYMAIGALHSLFKPVPGKFKDYIAIPKSNSYQSLHTTLIGPHGTPVEIQVRTQEMHHVAQEGVAAHWLYKDVEESGADLQIKTHRWLQSLLEMQSGDSAEFFENVKIDLFPDQVYVFTPRGKIMSLPRGATVIDFAYNVHTDVGHHCSAARINQELAPLSTQLHNGDMVEIVTAPHVTPKPEWLGIVRTGRARSKIRHFLRTMQNEESSSLGERLLNQELLSLGVVPAAIPREAWNHLVKACGKRTLEDLYADIGLGKRLSSVVARRLLARDELSVAAPSRAALAIRGTEGMAVQLAHCCQPIPGDPIIGSIKKGSGLIIHVGDCPTIRKSRSREPHQWINVEWEPEEGKLFDVRIMVEVKNQRGALAQAASAIAAAGSNIDSVAMDANPDKLVTLLHFTIEVANRTHLAAVMRRLRHAPEVTRIAREREGEGEV
ncbi:MAG: bifunctional (p)ppGpp synthetase/guanosine-3',5'-bis(diphosphate) 3'-pyrophosphohydrolase [Dechloromonas sp.]|uniref:Bifunctional (P)ppGpp synthetase/guanosine-3',5'-bis(Diphosphate) 3'-pyrophosphohydrolase n=1 Tax=Candidatus Dechloromonas phosphorivorans TaxID=2899244 RepID=A0A9D7QK06_9RHOO|nr:bifunctional (p)ppGpp synthetase/guanosine-3',5'-bis(diphosphate) 3'-pyrophosphohydrolase [Candidatus Dechloromonas phosphorivorans]